VVPVSSRYSKTLRNETDRIAVAFVVHAPGSADGAVLPDRSRSSDEERCRHDDRAPAGRTAWDRDAWSGPRRRSPMPPDPAAVLSAGAATVRTAAGPDDHDCGGYPLGITMPAPARSRRARPCHTSGTSRRPRRRVGAGGARPRSRLRIGARRYGVADVTPPRRAAEPRCRRAARDRGPRRHPGDRAWTPRACACSSWARAVGAARIDVGRRLGRHAETSPR
jgi:hypothetical protein